MIAVKTQAWVYRSITTGVLAFFANAALSQNMIVEVEQKPPVPLPNSISGGESVKSRMDKFIRDQGLRDVKDEKRDESGRTVLIDFANATIAAKPSDPAFVASRIFAFEKALLTAKGQCAEFQKTMISTEAISDMSQPPAARIQADAAQLKRQGLAAEGSLKVAQALNADFSKKDMPEVLKTAGVYGEKLLNMKVSEELKKKGFDPSKPVESQQSKAIVESASFQSAVATVAAARCTGLKVLAAFEQNPPDKQGSVGIITVWTEKLHAMADAVVTNNWALIPQGEPGGPKIRDQIPTDLATLLTTYGTMMVRNEKGEYVLLAYSQASPRTDSQQSIDVAYEVAKTRAMGLIRSFMGESVEVNRNLLGAEKSDVLEDGSTMYQENSSFQKSIKAVGDKLPISGLTEAYTWETRHPANNGPVVGVVMQWRVASAQIAGALAAMNQASGAKAATAATAAAPSNGGATPSGGSSNNTAKPEVKKKSDAYQGSGAVSKDF